METTKIDITDLMNIEDYARLKKVTRQTVYNWIENGWLKDVTILNKRFIDTSTETEKIKNK